MKSIGAVPLSRLAERIISLSRAAKGDVLVIRDEQGEPESLKFTLLHPESGRTAELMVHLDVFADVDQQHDDPRCISFLTDMPTPPLAIGELPDRLDQLWGVGSVPEDPVPAILSPITAVKSTQPLRTKVSWRRRAWRNLRDQPVWLGSRIWVWWYPIERELVGKSFPDPRDPGNGEKSFKLPFLHRLRLALGRLLGWHVSVHRRHPWYNLPIFGRSR